MYFNIVVLVAFLAFLIVVEGYKRKCGPSSAVEMESCTELLKEMERKMKFIKVSKKYSFPSQHALNEVVELCNMGVFCMAKVACGDSISQIAQIQNNCNQMEYMAGVLQYWRQHSKNPSGKRSKRGQNAMKRAPTTDDIEAMISRAEATRK